MIYLGLYNYFSVILSRDEVTHTKSPGKYLLLACKKLKVRPEEAAYVSDSASDILAAKDVGCISIAIITGMGMRKFLEKEHPDYIFKDLSEMTKHFGG